MLTSGGVASGGHHKMIGTSRNNQIIAPAGTKNKVGGTGAHIHTALVNLGSSSIGNSIDEMGIQGAMGNSQILNRTLGGTSATAGGNGNRYF